MAKVIYKLGDQISTSIIYPDQYLSITDPLVIPQHAFADNSVLNDKLRTKSPAESMALVSGLEFGCGAQRLEAVKALMGNNVVVIAKSVSAAFKADCANLGYTPVVCPGLDADVDDDLEIQTNKVINKTKNKEYSIIP